MGSVLYDTSVGARESTASVLHSQQVVDVLSEFQQELNGAEAALRGYLLSSHPSFCSRTVCVKVLGNFRATRASSVRMLRLLILAGVLAFVPVLVYSTAAPKRLYGHVIAAPEGDVVIVATAGQKIMVRLAGIDAPQLPQPHGMKAREILSALSLGRDIECIEKAAYRANGVIAFCTIAGVDLSTEQVRRGHAWAYDAYDQLRSIQDEAQTARVGLWRDPNPVPPWRW